MARAVVEARVGGSFWRDAPQMPGRARGSGDPWRIIACDSPIVAAPDDELALLATLADRPVLDPATGSPICPDRAIRALCERIDSYEYRDPFDGHIIDVLDWIHILGDWRRRIEADRRIGPVVGITRWKRNAVGSFLWAGRSPTFVSAPALERLASGTAIGVWPSRASAGLIDQAAAVGVPVIHIEDGFIRSMGLGTHLYPPCSIVVDQAGIYYDPTRPSDLERLLNETEFTPPLMARSAALIEALNRHGITKYGAGGGRGSSDTVGLPRAGRRVLVPGQVEDDLSVRWGGGNVAGNLDLLRRVRAAEPGAHIIYKPHPDVAAGLRKGHVDRADALRFADTVTPNVPLAPLLDQVEAVHVLTSLTGFEALLRGRDVVTHGQPFYAGWGLTTDLAEPVARRARTLTLEQLVAGVLILYPRYRDPITGLPCPPEILIQRHALTGRPRPTVLQRLRAMQGKLLARATRRSRQAA